MIDKIVEIVCRSEKSLKISSCIIFTIILVILSVILISIRRFYGKYY